MRRRFVVFAALGLLVSACAGGQIATPPLRDRALQTALQTTDWTQFAYDAARDGYNPLETTMNPASVGSLKLKWARNIDAGMFAQPLFVRAVSINGASHDVLYVAGFFKALAIDAKTSSVLWSTPLQSSTMNCGGGVVVREGAYATPYIDKASGRIYLADGADHVVALNMTTGSVLYSKKLDTYSNAGIDGAISYNPNLQRLYASNALRCGDENLTTPMHGRIFALSAPTGAIVAAFTTVSSSGFYGGGIWSAGGASMDPAGNVYVSSGNSWPSSASFGEHINDAEHVLSFGSGLALRAANYPSLKGRDKDFGATPTQFTPNGCAPMVALANKNGEMLVYHRDAISSGPIARFAMANSYPGDFIDAPAWDPVTQRIYETSSTDSTASAIYKHGWSAFAFVHCTPTFVLNAQEGTVAPTGTNPPDDPYSPATVADGVVYFGAGYTNRVFANDAMTGRLLWQSPVLPGHVFTPPIVVNGQLFFGDTKGNVYAYGL